jgi:hypothetical protein
MTRTWTQLTHAHKRYARSRTTPERDQASGRVCDGFIPNNAFYKMDKLDDVTRILELVGAEPKPWATLVEAIMRAPPSDAMLRVWRRRGGG